MTCPQCRSPLTFVTLRRTTRAEIFYEDEADIIINQEGKDVVVTRTGLCLNSDESVGDTLDQNTKAYCGLCITELEMTGIEAFGVVVDNVFEESDES
jgi:hypothetical protein